MQRQWLWIGLAASLWGACLGDARSEDNDKENPAFSTRSIIRTGLDKKGRVQGALATTLPEIKKATSLNYKILRIDADGKERYVAEDFEFQFGDQFRLEVIADADMYVYIFHEGPDGLRSSLVPDAHDEGRVPMVQKGQTVILPDDDTCFQFVPPGGTERLLVYASPEVRPELTPEEAFQGDGVSEEKRLKLKSTQDKIFENARNSKMKPIVSSDVTEVAKAASEPDSPTSGFRFRGGLLWKPKGNADEGQTVLVGSQDEKEAIDLYIEIPLSAR